MKSFISNPSLGSALKLAHYLVSHVISGTLPREEGLLWMLMSTCVEHRLGVLIEHIRSVLC